jgi:hypothetical protein
MMSDLRGNNTPNVETANTTGKIVSAVIVALAVGVIGTVSYASGTWDTHPRQIVASNTQVEAPKGLLPPEPLPVAEPSVPAQAAAVPPPAPVENLRAKTLPKAAAAPPIRIARTQTPADTVLQSPSVQPSGNFSAQAPSESIAPAATIPEQPAPQETSIAPPVNAPSQDAPAQIVPEQLAPPVAPEPAPQP